MPNSRFLLLACLSVCTFLSMGCASSKPGAAQKAFPELNEKIRNRVIAGDSYSSPKLLRSVLPVYPRLRASGVVTAVMRIGKAGRVEEVRLVGDAPDAYRSSIQTALLQWTFTPGTMDGKPCDSLVSVPIRFVDSVENESASKESGIKPTTGAWTAVKTAGILQAELAEHKKAGRKITPPKIIKTVAPKLPENLPDGLSAVVVFIVNEKGRAENIEIIGEVPKAMRDSLVQAFNLSVFQPATVNGRPQAWPLSIPMAFPKKR